MAPKAAPNSPQSPPVEETQQGATETTNKSGPLPLPEPPKDGSGKPINITVGGEGVKLDHMGPLVVNVDGTMSRINNWTQMSDIERENTLRILGKRNQQRLKKLRESSAAAGGPDAGAEGGDR